MRNAVRHIGGASQWGAGGWRWLRKLTSRSAVCQPCSAIRSEDSHGGGVMHALRCVLEDLRATAHVAQTGRSSALQHNRQAPRHTQCLRGFIVGVVDACIGTCERSNTTASRATTSHATRSIAGHDIAAVSRAKSMLQLVNQARPKGDRDDREKASSRTLAKEREAERIHAQKQECEQSNAIDEMTPDSPGT